MSSATAPGKIILCGEHAVVYGCPAIALPLAHIQAQVEVADAPPGSGLVFQALNLDRGWCASKASGDPFGELAFATLRRLGQDTATPDLVCSITSTIPIASGMGSGAAVATALVRALASHVGESLCPAEVSELVYASETRFHGTPSGLDNTVIAYNQPVWFVRAGAAEHQPSPAIEPLTIAAPFTLIIGDTGVRCKTSLPVGAVRQYWQANPEPYNALFEQVAAVVRQVRTVLAAGDVPSLGPLLNENQTLLEHIGVSSPDLEHLVAAARAAGATGAKLSGGGWGGIMLALALPDTSAAIADALRQAGAAQVLETTIEPYPGG